jgi:hypothetical protein
MVPLTRRSLLGALVGVSAAFLTVPQRLLADDPSAPPESWNVESPLIHAPSHVEGYPKFRDELIAGGRRASRRDRRYRDPSFQWVCSNFATIGFRCVVDLA